MFVKDYYTQNGEVFAFSRQQGSDFAKQIAGDFNPLHDIENSRFCVPGDLLFALTLSQFGVSQQMDFDFQGMVGGDTLVEFQPSDDLLVVKDLKEKKYLSVSRKGEINKNAQFVEALIQSYVAFSGETFPHILVNLMKKEGVMINPERPMVIYESMQINFTQFSEVGPQVLLQDSRFDVNGKRGVVTLEFDLQANGQSIGSGKKQIIMGGLRPYEEQSMERLVDHYDGLKQSYVAKK